MKMLSLSSAQWLMLANASNLEKDNLFNHMKTLTTSIMFELNSSKNYLKIQSAVLGLEDNGGAGLS